MSIATVSASGFLGRHFSPGRWFKLLRADLIQYRNSLSIAFVAVYGAVLLALVALAPTSGGWQPHETFVPFIIYAGGLAVISYSFIELTDPVRRSAYLLVPASTLEKVSARLVLTLLAFPAATLVLYWVTSLVGAGLGTLIWDRSFGIYNPLTENTVRLLAHYPMIHAVFFLGAIWFRKGSVFKTLLSVVIAQLGLAIIAAFFFRIVFFEFFEGLGLDHSMEFQLNVIDAGWLTSDLTAQLGEVFAYLLFGPWLWVISYLRLADTESS
jgi:hypothetical protein